MAILAQGLGFDRTTGGEHMELVVPGDISVEGEPAWVGLPWILIALLGCCFSLGCFCGTICRASCCKASSSDKPKAKVRVRTGKGAVDSWDRLASKALRFIARRRRIGIAFGTFRESTLRNTPVSQPTKSRVARRRTASRPASVIHEGPAISHGSHRG